MANPDQPARVAVLEPSDGDTRNDVAALLDRAERATGHPPLSEHSRLAWDGIDGEFVGLVLLSDGPATGYAHLGWRDRSWTVEIVLGHEGPARAAARRRLLEAAVETARASGATEVRYWVTPHEEKDEPEVRSLGFVTERDLLQLRVVLPLAAAGPPLDEAFTLRAFRPGTDEAAWLAVNNRAFAAHPEQGQWDLATLLARERASWFDPDGFLLCETHGRLAGSCWTKVHAGAGLGEIYVISVDPAFQHHGLGRALTVAGLGWLAERVTVGMLYVDSANEPAVELYRSLGFALDHVDRCYLLAT